MFIIIYLMNEFEVNSIEIDWFKWSYSGTWW